MGSFRGSRRCSEETKEVRSAHWAPNSDKHLEIALVQDTAQKAGQTNIGCLLKDRQGACPSSFFQKFNFPLPSHTILLETLIQHWGQFLSEGSIQECQPDRIASLLSRGKLSRGGDSSCMLHNPGYGSGAPWLRPAGSVSACLFPFFQEGCGEFVVRLAALCWGDLGMPAVGRKRYSVQLFSTR